MEKILDLPNLLKGAETKDWQIRQHRQETQTKNWSKGI